jgi:hypothetical protein
MNEKTNEWYTKTWIGCLAEGNGAFQKWRGTLNGEEAPVKQQEEEVLKQMEGSELDE